jgi:hypothetical protein
MTRLVSLAISRSRTISSCCAAMISQPGQRLAAEVGEVRDCPVGLGQAFFESVDVGLESGDLGDARVWRLVGLLHLTEAVFKLGSQMGVGPVAVEGGAVDACFADEGHDVAVTARRDLAAEEPAHRCPDAVVVLGSLGRADSHAVSWSGEGVVAASISAMTRRAHS